MQATDKAISTPLFVGFTKRDRKKYLVVFIFRREPTHIDCDTNVAAKLSGLAFIGAFPGTFVTVNASRVITFASGYS